MIVTAFAAPDVIERAFALGAYDYLEKGRNFTALLRAKVRNASEAVRERRLGELDAGGRETELQAAWIAATTETDRPRKGKLLEQFMLLLFRTIPGFHHVRTNVRNEIEEVDLLIRNESQDPLWSKEGPFFLAECKNWSSRVGAC